MITGVRLKSENQKESTEHMRLFIVGIKVPPETFLVRKIRGLMDRGVEVTIFSTSTKKLPSEISGARLVRLNRRSGKRALLSFVKLLVHKLRTNPREVIRAWQVARKHAPHQLITPAFRQLLSFVGELPDIIHFEWNIAAIEHLPLFDFFACPVTISCRGRQVQVSTYGPKGQALVEGLRETFARAEAVHCVSEAIREEAAEFGLDRAKAHTIRPAVDPAYFEPCPSSNGNPIIQIVTTGSLIWRKGHEYTLMALHLLKQRGHQFCFELIGTGQELQRVLYTAIDLGIEEQVRLAGQRTPQQVKETLQKADIFVLSSHSEGIANAVLEAMACGLPVVTTDCGGMREAITNGVDGYVVPLRDPEAMADALETLIMNETLRAAIGKAARARIIESFTLDQQAEQFLRMYRNVLAEPKDEEMQAVAV
jgi:colanic acid/amylovoran biosynthesis glycosyltransferase